MLLTFMWLLTAYLGLWLCSLIATGQLTDIDSRHTWADVLYDYWLVSIRVRRLYAWGKLLFMYKNVNSRRDQR